MFSMYLYVFFLQPGFNYCVVQCIFTSNQHLNFFGLLFKPLNLKGFFHSVTGLDQFKFFVLCLTADKFKWLNISICILVLKIFINCFMKYCKFKT